MPDGVLDVVVDHQRIALCTGAVGPGVADSLEAIGRRGVVDDHRIEGVGGLRGPLPIVVAGVLRIVIIVIDGML